MSPGVRALSILDQLPDCDVQINSIAYQLEDYCAGSTVLDIGCGHGPSRTLIEQAGGKWIGLERFPGGVASVFGDAEALPFCEASVDVILMEAVLEHVPDVSRAFQEVGRVLKPNGVFLGYAAFMECFHEISYSHLSFRAIEHLSQKNGMSLLRIAGGTAFGIDYHTAVLLYPLPTQMLRRFMAASIRLFIRIKAALAARLVARSRHLSRHDRERHRVNYFTLECLRQSNGFTFLIRKT